MSGLPPLDTEAVKRNALTKTKWLVIRREKETRI